MSDFETYKAIQRRAESCADRWVKAWPQSAGYVGVDIDSVSIDLNKYVIHFSARPSCSGMHPRHAISIKYLENDDGLERDSRDWYKKDWDERLSKSNRVEELRRSEAVRELGVLGYVVEPYQPRVYL